MEYLILAVLVVLAILMFSLSARQKRALRSRREKILMRIRERKIKSKRKSEE